jgi:hypothetical protein
MCVLMGRRLGARPQRGSLDERKLKEWLDLFTDDVLYFMPRRKRTVS